MMTTTTMTMMTMLMETSASGRVAVTDWIRHWQMAVGSGWGTEGRLTQKDVGKKQRIMKTLPAVMMTAVVVMTTDLVDRWQVTDGS
jgi:hypothetical protein